VYTVFAPHSLSYTLFPDSLPSHLHQCPPPTPGRTCSTLLLSDFVKEKNDSFLKMAIHKFPRCISMYTCIITWIDYFLLSSLVPFLWWFNRFKNSIFILVYRVHQPY
jgi:hypothetical protein